MSLITPKRAGVVCGLIAGVAIVLLELHVINQSSSSTASIGILFLPIPFTLAFIYFFLVGTSVTYFVLWYRSKISVSRWKAIVAACIGAGLTLLFVVTAVYQVTLIRVTAHIETIDTLEELQYAFEAGPLNRNKFVLGMIAQHPLASSELLHDIALIEDPKLFKPMGSYFPIMGENQSRGLAVMRLVASHEHTRSETLEFLAEVDFPGMDQVWRMYVLSSVASNPNTPVHVLSRLVAYEESVIDWSLAHNRNSPPDVFEKLIEREEQYVDYYLAENTQTPEHIFRILLGREYQCSYSPDCAQKDKNLLLDRLSRNPSVPADIVHEARQKMYAPGAASQLPAESVGESEGWTTR